MLNYYRCNTNNERLLLKSAGSTIPLCGEGLSARSSDPGNLMGYMAEMNSRTEKTECCVLEMMNVMRCMIPRLHKLTSFAQSIYSSSELFRGPIHPKDIGLVHLEAVPRGSFHGEQFDKDSEDQKKMGCQSVDMDGHVKESENVLETETRDARTIPLPPSLVSTMKILPIRSAVDPATLMKFMAEIDARIQRIECQISQMTNAMNDVIPRLYKSATHLQAIFNSSQLLKEPIHCKEVGLVNIELVSTRDQFGRNFNKIPINSKEKAKEREWKDSIHERVIVLEKELEKLNEDRCIPDPDQASTSKLHELSRIAQFIDQSSTPQGLVDIRGHCSHENRPTHADRGSKQKALFKPTSSNLRNISIQGQVQRQSGFKVAVDMRSHKKRVPAASCAARATKQ